ncbi:hypothetical protein SLS60_011182 [Paraconiothyrium brasiliense]|uniref:DUF1749-domain-containing protein n=1 Tax=Paraconiothyrium brasiliense TaxID=300254 RepID=A0ABR3QKU2_9PLEO
MAHLGTLHLYTKKLPAFEHIPSNSPSRPQNTLLWIGGLSDGLLTVKYPTSISQALPKDWSLAEVLLSSAYDGWGTGSLARDAEEVGKCVAYFKSLRPSGKVVLMGHSTGCQDVMEYLVGAGNEERERIDGAVLQAGLSDREGWEAIVADDPALKESLEETIDLATKWVEAGDGDAILPKKGNKVLEMFESPCTAYRAYSLLVKGGDDDYFSTDLEDETLEGTFGKIPSRTKVMFLWGSKDPYIPEAVDQESTLKRWAKIVKGGGGSVDEVNGGVIKGATHNLNDDPEDVVQELVGRVVRFVGGL